jgi:CheY-like chemotaxis protein
MRRVLVLDDDPPACALVARILREADYDVVMTTDPNRAVAHLDAGEQFDLALIDVVMPEMTGDQFASVFRRHHPDAPLLFVTGRSDELFAARGSLGPGEYCVSKPFSRDGLLDAVSMALQRDASGGAA